MREDLRHQDRRRALAVRRQLDQLVPAIVAGDRLDVGRRRWRRSRRACGCRRARAARRPCPRPPRPRRSRRGRRGRSGAAPRPGRARGTPGPAPAPRRRGGRSAAPRRARRRRRAAPVARGARRDRHPRLGVADRRREARGEAEPAPVGRRAARRRRPRRAPSPPPPPAAASRACPAARSASASSPAGARPEPFSPTSRSSPAGFSSTKESPPRPHVGGSEKPSSTAAAIAASTALPPSCRMPHRDLRRQRVRGGAHAVRRHRPASVREPGSRASALLPARPAIEAGRPRVRQRLSPRLPKPPARRHGRGHDR